MDRAVLQGHPVLPDQRGQQVLVERLDRPDPQVQLVDLVPLGPQVPLGLQVVKDRRALREVPAYQEHLVVLACLDHLELLALKVPQARRGPREHLERRE